MKKAYTWAAKPAMRNITVADLRAGKGQKIFTQVTTNTTEEALAAAEADIDLLICNAANVQSVRAGCNDRFLTAALPMPDYPTSDDVLRGAYKALELGADQVMTARSMQIVEMLAREEIPVMGHLGLVPRKSTWVGGLRAVGKTGQEAFALFQKFKQLENAGAVSVEAEVIPGSVMAEITRRTGLITVSLGSGLGADVAYLFMNDICGEDLAAPRHARAFGNLHALYEQIKIERVQALKSFRQASLDRTFPGTLETVDMDPEELRVFTEKLESSKDIVG